jgi:hypothetical protein
MDVIHASAHLSDTELVASSAMMMEDKDQVVDLLAHMTEVQEEVVDELAIRLRELERAGFGSEVGKMDDDVTCFAKTHDLNENTPGRPPEFPIHLWKYVANSTRPLVQARWDIYEPQRLAEILEQAKTADIEPTRPNQRPYWEAFVFAHLDRFFRPDEDNPPPPLSKVSSFESSRSRDARPSVTGINAGTSSPKNISR